MKIVDGSTLARKVLDRLAADLRRSGRLVHLAAVYADGDPALKTFVRLKKVAAESAGIQFSAYELPPADAPTGNPINRVTETVNFLADDPSVTGILIELPLPNGWDVQGTLDLIPLAKDVDVLSSLGQQAFYENRSRILPPAVGALKLVVDEYKINLKGKRAAVFGQGGLVGRPIAHWLEFQGAEVDRIDESTPDPAAISIKADILVSGVGKPGLITAAMVKQDAIVIDFGYGKKGNQMLGDVDSKNLAKKASIITPVPGGMGPLVIAAVMENLVLG